MQCCNLAPPLKDNRINKLQLRRGVTVRVSGLACFRLLGRGVEGTGSVRSHTSFCSSGSGGVNLHAINPNIIGFRV